MIPYGAKELAAAFRTVRTNTLQIAADIPEDKYEWAPAAGTRTVRSVLTHIAVVPRLQEDMHAVKRVTTLQGYDFRGMIAQLFAEESTPRTKAQTIEFVRNEGERFATWLETLSPGFLAETFTGPMGLNPKTRFEGLLGVKEHEMHHRGQLMLIQRLIGLVPHLTRQMEERMAVMAAAKV